MIHAFREDDRAFRRWRRLTTGYVLNIQQQDGPWDPVVLHATDCRTLDAATTGPWYKVGCESKLQLLEWARGQRLSDAVSCRTCGA